MNFLANNRISMVFILQNRCKIEVDGKSYRLDHVRLYSRGKIRIFEMLSAPGLGYIMEKEFFNGCRAAQRMVHLRKYYESN